ncbi:MAG: YcxB family protein [Erythrobacter sp.]|uniref:YcxB family protein n=1 Tax=Erythrobacter sp. TaxID=1042 RepID=UPI003263C998
MEPVTYKVAEGEFVAFWMLSTRNAFWICLPLFSGYLLLLVGLQIFLVSPEWIFWLSCVMATLVGYMVLQRYILSPRLLKAIYADDAAFKEAITLTFDDEKMERRFPSGHYSVRWDKVVKWNEDETILAVFQNRQLGSVLPKAKLGEKRVDAIRAHLIRNGLETKGKLRK